MGPIPSSHQDPAKHAAIAVRSARVVELKNEGLTFREIADQLGVSLGTVWKDFDRALERVMEPNVNAYRADAHARLVKVREVVEDVINRRHLVVSASGRVAVDEDENPLEDDGVVLAAANQLIRIDEREAKLLGLDAKNELAVTGNLTYEFLGLTDEVAGEDASPG